VQIRGINRNALGDPGHVEEPERLIAGRTGAVERALIEITRQLARKIADKDSIQLGSGLPNQERPDPLRSTIAMTATADNPSETELVFFDLERSRLEELQATAAGCGTRASFRASVLVRIKSEFGGHVLGGKPKGQVTL
jgi:hypothetical protein